MMEGWSDSLSSVQCEAATTRVRDFSLTPAVTVPTGTSLAQTLQLMKEKQVSLALVTGDGGKLQGLFRPADAIRVAVLVEDAASVKIEQCLGGPVVSVDQDASVSRAIHLMAQAGLDFIPVVDAQRVPVGMLSNLVAESFLSQVK
jgi:CBS domain-containing protein